jgi:hypothetical protein
MKNVEAMIPVSWNFTDTFKIFWADPFLANLAVVVLFYYTAVVRKIENDNLVFLTLSLSFL